MTDQPPAKPKRVYPRKTDRKRRPSPVLPDTAELTVAFELDPATTPPRFQLDVYPGEIEAADQKVLDVLAGRLAKLCEGKEVAIYFGSPDAA